MALEPKDVINIATMEEFNKIKDALNLTDRQREVFYKKYSCGKRLLDIANDLKVHQDTITVDMKVIREKLKQYSYENNGGSDNDG